MTNYAEALRAHLGPYKRYRLGVNEDGLSRGGFMHAYILPEVLPRLNILETYRREFWEYYDGASGTADGLSLQPGFHHLDATQALSFNLFIPFVSDPAARDLLMAGLDRMPEPMTAMRFDRLIERADMLRCDFSIELQTGANLLFELKLAEASFDAVRKPTPGQIQRLNTTYAPLLEDKVPAIYLQEANFFKYDHILRNIALLDLARGDHLYILYPRDNAGLARQETEVATMCAPYLRDHVTLLHLDDVVRRLIEAGSDHRFLCHFEMFADKYLLRVR